MEDEENFYVEGPYQAHVCGFFLTYHQVLAYPLWLLFRSMDLEHYRELEVSLERVMFIPCLLITFDLMDKKFCSFGTCIRHA